jgi:hypothetical protein
MPLLHLSKRKTEYKTHCGLRVASYGFRVMGCGVRVTGFKFRVKSYQQKNKIDNIPFINPKSEIPNRKTRNLLKLGLLCSLQLQHLPGFLRCRRFQPVFLSDADDFFYLLPAAFGHGTFFQV